MLPGSSAATDFSFPQHVEIFFLSFAPLFHMNRGEKSCTGTELP